jgi:hypothetical protein
MVNLIIMWLSKNFMDNVVNTMEKNMGIEKDD